MLYDLNIAWSPGTSASDLERTLKFAKHLGYDVVALNHLISGPIPTLPNAITNPIPQLTPPHSSYPGRGYSSSIPSSTASSLPASSSSSSLPTALRRATLTITDPSTTNYRLPDYGRAYDLVALRPTSDKSFSWACLSTSEPPALISLDLSSHLPFHIHHRTVMAAVQRGVRFEICYAQAFASSSSSSNSSEAARQRANFIGNAQSLIRATKGRGIVVSSEARGALGLRGPADVVNLLAVWGLGPERGFAALGETARAVVVNEGIRRRGFRGVVDIVRPAEGGGGGEKGRDRKGPQGGEAEDGKAAGKKQQQQQGQKRKNGAGNGGNTPGGAGKQTEMSRQQAKKMKRDTLPAKS
ncbi:PHP domain-like protein [Canariomyces notabilis]|uniref:PHP domain-like protein n=1 Tax=Canariomyces notabilis TaxID=2074819 RepID=A0AAN6TLN2_9PEZI|nr:PHP domain-like protein [Canariomyces arenarius]